MMIKEVKKKKKYDLQNQFLTLYNMQILAWLITIISNFLSYKTKLLTLFLNLQPLKKVDSINKFLNIAHSNNFHIQNNFFLNI